jgi:hypothetical protein
MKRRKKTSPEQPLEGGGFDSSAQAHNITHFQIKPIVIRFHTRTSHQPQLRLQQRDLPLHRCQLSLRIDIIITRRV